MSPPPTVKGASDKIEEEEYEPYSDEDESPLDLPETEDTVDATGRLIDHQTAYDQIINSEVLLQQGDEMMKGKVKQQSIGPDGRTVGGLVTPNQE
jgi:hypothetical protein